MNLRGIFDVSISIDNKPFFDLAIKNKYDKFVEM